MPMTIKGFLAEVAEVVRLQVPPHYREFQTVGPWGGLIKLHFGDPHIHYEVWVQRRNKIVELGLHFEGKPQVNTRYLERLAPQVPKIQAALKVPVEAHQWTHRWTRIHQSIPIEPLEEDFIWEVATRTTRMISVLEPLLEEVGTPSLSGNI